MLRVTITKERLRFGTATVPKWYGIAYWDFASQTAICYPLGLHWLVAAWRRACWWRTAIEIRIRIWLMNATTNIQVKRAIDTGNPNDVPNIRVGITIGEQLVYMTITRNELAKLDEWNVSYTVLGKPTA